MYYIVSSCILNYWLNELIRWGAAMWSSIFRRSIVAMLGVTLCCSAPASGAVTSNGNTVLLRYRLKDPKQSLLKITLPVNQSELTKLIEIQGKAPPLQFSTILFHVGNRTSIGRANDTGKVVAVDFSTPGAVPAASFDLCLRSKKKLTLLMKDFDAREIFGGDQATLPAEDGILQLSFSIVATKPMAPFEGQGTAELFSLYFNDQFFLRLRLNDGVMKGKEYKGK